MMKATQFLTLRRMIILLVVTTVFLIIYVWTRVKTVELSLKYSSLVKQERELLEEQSRLRLEIASLKSADKLTEIAISKLGFKKESNAQKIYVRLEKE